MTLCHENRPDTLQGACNKFWIALDKLLEAVESKIRIPLRPVSMLRPLTVMISGLTKLIKSMIKFTRGTE